MPQPPSLSTEQRATAFQRSLELRRQRSEIKQSLTLRTATLSEVCALDAAQGMKVIDLLTALPGIGRVKAERLLAQAGIPVKNTVRRCGPQQKIRLLVVLEQR